MYPYQEGATFADGTIYANVPQVQIASAGNVPQNAFIAAAKSDADGLLKFTTVLSYIRFKLVDTNAGNIESMTLSGNSGEKLAGSVKITFDQGIPSDVIDSNGQVYSSVILSGSFENGKDYLFAVREQASFSNGVTISILYKNGSRRYISSSSNFVNESGESITFAPNMVLNIREFSVAQMNEDIPSDRYLAYLHGYDVEIADTTYNIANNGLPTLIKAPEGGSVGISAQIKGRQSGVFFLDSSLGECKLETHTVVAGDHVALVGRYKDKPNAFTPRAYIELRGGNFLMYHLDVDLQNVKYSSDNSRIGYFIVAGTTLSSDATQENHVESIVIDSCKVRNMWTNLIVQSEKNTTFTFKKIKIINSDIEIDKNIQVNDHTARILNLSGISVQCGIEEFVFDNNIVFHRFKEPGAIQMTCRVFDVGKDKDKLDASFANQTWNTSISFCNNTMLNVPTGAGYVRAYKVKNVKINENICAVVQEGYDYSSGYLIYLFNWDKGEDIVDIQEGGNLFYGLDDNPKNWNIANASSAWHPTQTLTPPWKNNNPPRSDYPFQTIDFDTFTFTPLADYDTFGAKR